MEPLKKYIKQKHVWQEAERGHSLTQELLGFLSTDAFKYSLPIYFLSSEVKVVHRVLLETVLTESAAVHLWEQMTDALLGHSAGIAFQ